MSKLIYLGVAVNVLLLAGVPIYWYAKGELPAGLLDENDPAAAQIAKWIFMNNELAQGMIMNAQITIGLTLPALVAAPRAYRVMPCLFMVFWLMYCSTYRENQLLLEATGKPNSMINNVLHGIMALVYVAMISLPDTRKDKTEAESVTRGMSKLIYFGIALNVLFSTGVPVYWYAKGELPPGLLDENDPAALQIARWAFMNNELAQGIIMNSQIFIGLVLPALAAAPRAYRVMPCLFMVFSIMYCNTYRQNQLVLAATGKPNPMISNVIHSFMAIVYVAVIVLPDTIKGKMD